MGLWKLHPDGSVTQPWAQPPRATGKVPDNTQTSGNKPAGTPRKTSGSKVPPRQTRGKVSY